MARWTAAGILLLRAPRLLLDLHLAAMELSWDRAPALLAYVAPVTDEASALVLPLVAVAVDRCRRGRDAASVPRWAPHRSWRRAATDTDATVALRASSPPAR